MREGVPLPRNALEPLGTKALKRSPDRAPVIWLGTSPFNRGCTFRRAAHFELMVVQSLRHSKRWLPTCRRGKTFAVMMSRSRMVEQPHAELGADREKN